MTTKISFQERAAEALGATNESANTASYLWLRLPDDSEIIATFSDRSLGSILQLVRLDWHGHVVDDVSVIRKDRDTVRVVKRPTPHHGGRPDMTDDMAVIVDVLLGEYIDELATM